MTQSASLHLSRTCWGSPPALPWALGVSGNFSHGRDPTKLQGQMAMCSHSPWLEGPSTCDSLRLTSSRARWRTRKAPHCRGDKPWGSLNDTTDPKVPAQSLSPIPATCQPWDNLTTAPPPTVPHGSHHADPPWWPSMGRMRPLPEGFMFLSHIQRLFLFVFS